MTFHLGKLRSLISEAEIPPEESEVRALLLYLQRGGLHSPYDLDPLYPCPELEKDLEEMHSPFPLEVALVEYDLAPPLKQAVEGFKRRCGGIGRRA